ncbi:MAG: acyltransferase [Acidobacteria bacterium]|nr:MAG: acyltransferase [Acidobacteriota bacterium]
MAYSRKQQNQIAFPHSTRGWVIRIMGKTSTSKPFFVPGYIPQFDGLRGVAILLVLIGHSGFLEALPHLGGLQYTRFGVDLFFVLSGFLITGILLDSKGSEHYFRKFYARRALRIWPLYYLLLFLVFVVAPLFRPSMRVTAAGVWPSFVFYVQNIALVYRDAYPFALGATWSLAVEEQFYLTWPPLVFLLRKRALAIVSVSLVVVSLSLRLAGYFHGAPVPFIHQFTLSRLDSIALGALAALWLRSPTCTLAQWRIRAYQFLALGLAGTLLARLLMHRNSSILGYTFLAIAFTGFLGLALVSDTKLSLLGRSLSGSWLRYIGKISYGIYLLHYPIFVLWARFLRTETFCQTDVARNLLAFAGQMALAIVVASISWRLFEQPILRLKERFPSGSEMHWPEVEKSKRWNRPVVTDSRV